MSVEWCRLIFYWADGTWVDADEYNEAEYSYKSDDFGIIRIPDEMADSEIDILVDQQLA